MRFDLYLESGPQHKRTWVYVPSLAGCVAFGPTTEQAIANAPDAIRDRIAFLRRHGDQPLDPEPIELNVAEHFIERQMLGFGQQTFPTDREPLGAEEAERELRWVGWSREELIEAARSQKRPLGERPPRAGRSAAAILSHVAGAEWSYVSSALGTVPGGSAAITAIEAAGEEPWAALVAERETLMQRLRAMTPDERARVVEREGKPPRSARRMLRRMLEHEWEHVLELRARL
jgi:predicted RNase H-like HicB family nuclease